MKTEKRKVGEKQKDSYDQRILLRISCFVLCAFYFVLSGCATLPPRMAAHPLAPMAVEGITHVVGMKDTLWRIAQDYGVDMHEVMRVNRIEDPEHIQVGQTLVIPHPEIAPPLVPSIRPIPLDRALEKKVGERHPLSKWRHITVHHSATRAGNASSFHQNHKKRRMGGLFYHFVIGNGTGSGDGEVEVGWRWKKQVKSKESRPLDIQICLVGDFNEQELSESQFTSLVNLVHLLRRQYDIPMRNIRRHKDIQGSVTECPGRHFPFYWLLSELKKLDRRS